MVACPLAMLSASDCLSGDGLDANVGPNRGEFRTLELHLSKPHPPTDYQAALRARSLREAPANPWAPRASAQRMGVYSPAVNPPRYNASTFNPPAPLSAVSNMPSASSPALGFPAVNSASDLAPPARRRA